jgi:hypothetical protein
MAKRTKPSAFDLKMTAEERNELATELCREIDNAISARAAVIADGGQIDLADWFYEQGRSQPEDRPFPGAADLTSYFITENVDAFRSRLTEAVFGVRPFCFVEGWGQDAAKAPFVEEFTDWQARESDLKLALANTVHGALIEDAYILEVSEQTETMKRTETVENVALQTNPDGSPSFVDGHAQFQLDDQGEPVIATDPNQPAATVERTYTKTKRLGPKYEPISMKEFVFLPGHAKSQKHVWGYAYRFHKRISEVQEMADDGIYDAEAVKLIGESSDRVESMAQSAVADVAAQEGPSVEKEFYQVSLKRDLDEDGREEWYIATLSLRYRVLLRLKLDKFAMKVGRSRCVPFVLFPRRNSVYGYSYAYNKMLTLAEEHTALRNMIADRSALATNAPLMQMEGGLWDADAQPMGLGRVITVRGPNEITPLQIPDVTPSIMEQVSMVHQAKERVGGLADSAVGILSVDKRTLGENKLAAGGSAVRVKEVISHLHMAIAQVMKLSHAIWVETLESDPNGLEAPGSVAQALSDRGADFSGKFTVEMLKGTFAFIPYGSDDNADPAVRKQNFDSGMMALANLAKVVPGLQVVFQNQDVAKAILEQWLRAYDVKDRQPFLGAFTAAPAMPAGAGSPMGPAPAGVPGALPPGGGGEAANLQALLAPLTGQSIAGPTGVPAQ